MEKKKIEAGDKVIYKGVLAEVDRLGETFAGTPTADLISVDDPEMTCTAVLIECELFDEKTYDEDENNKALNDAKFNSRLMMMQIDGLTDKYCGDNSFD